MSPPRPSDRLPKGASGTPTEAPGGGPADRAAAYCCPVPRLPTDPRPSGASAARSGDVVDPPRERRPIASPPGWPIELRPSTWGPPGWPFEPRPSGSYPPGWPLESCPSAWYRPLLPRTSSAASWFSRIGPKPGNPTDCVPRPRSREAVRLWLAAAGMPPPPKPPMPGLPTPTDWVASDLSPRGTGGKGM